MNCEERKGFNQLVAEQTTFYQGFYKLESRKFAVMSENRLAELDGLVKQEEASLLRAKGLEKKRIEFLKACGMENCTMREIVATYPEEEKEAAEAAFQTLSDLILNFKQLNVRSGFLAKLRLRRAEKMIAELEKQNKKPLYTDKAVEVDEKGGSLSGRV